jgi:3-oxoacyl-[acyl-carrier-protein] synthase II
MNSSHGVLITGVGVVSPLGLGREEFWKRVVEGKPLFERTGGRAKVPDFDAPLIIKRKGIRYFGRGSLFLAAASVLAVEDAGVEGGEDLGQIVGTALGNNPETFNFTSRFLTRGVGNVLPMASFDSALNSQTNFASLVAGAQRFTKTLCGTTASLEGVLEGASLVRAGRAKAVLACGIDYLNEDLERILELEGRSAEAAVSEGAYVLVLEAADAAESRGARALAEVGTGALGFDAKGDATALARRVVSESLGGEGADIVVHCGAENPIRENAGVEIHVSDIAGECLGGRGALGAIIAALSLHTGMLPRNPRCAREKASHGQRALVVDFEPNGNFVSLVLSRPHPGGQRSRSNGGIA